MGLTIPEAATRLRTARRVMVFGVSGAGKSTLSQKIAAGRGLRYVSMDLEIRWLPGWTLRAPSERQRIESEIIAQENWVIDGMSLSTLPTRAARADLGIWMRPGRALALWGLAERVARYHGTVRPDMAEGCPEPVPDLNFLRWIWTFERQQSPRIVAALREVAMPVVQLRHYYDADALLQMAGLVSAEGASGGDI